MGEKLESNFRESKKMFWKEVKMVRKGDGKKEECVKDLNEMSKKACVGEIR